MATDKEQEKEEKPMADVQTQQMKILADLKRGYKVSNMTAFTRHKITRLGDIVYRLRAKGYQIDTIMWEKVDDDGKVRERWAEYKLGGKK
jgi:hypothetical protein